MPINYISSAYSVRYAQLYRLQELLRLDHNKTGEKYKLGQLTKEQWINYKENYFEPRQNLIIDEILKYRKLIREDETITTSLIDVVI